VLVDLARRAEERGVSSLATIGWASGRGKTTSTWPGRSDGAIFFLSASSVAQPEQLAEAVLWPGRLTKRPRCGLPRWAGEVLTW